MNLLIKTYLAGVAVGLGGMGGSTGSLITFCYDYLEKFSSCLKITDLIINCEAFVLGVNSLLYSLIFSMFPMSNTFFPSYMLLPLHGMLASLPIKIMYPWGSSSPLRIPVSSELLRHLPFGLANLDILTAVCLFLVWWVLLLSLWLDFPPPDQDYVGTCHMSC